MSRRDENADDRAEDTSRRDFLKVTGAASATGALGALAGCSGNGGDGGDGGDGSGSGSGSGGSGSPPPIGGDGSGGETTTDGGDGSGGGSESVTIQYLSAEAAENSLTGPHFEESVSRFGEQNNVTVNLSTTSYSDVRQQISSTVSAGNAPALAESGGAGLQYFDSGDVPDHAQWVEGSDSYPDDWSVAGRETANFRGSYWSGGPLRHSVSALGIRPKMFSQAGVSDPSQFETWSGFYEAVQMVDEEFPDAYAYEETGVGGDLESYWGQARTAYTEGTDPWMRGEGTDPDVVIGGDHEDAPKTDGMIKNTVTLANEFSSDSAAQRGDEEIPSLMLTDRVGSFTYMTQNFTRWRQVKEDATFGWNDGEGDVMLLPNPRVDPEYGSNIGISELEGVEGNHGGHVWALEQAHSVYDTGDQAKMDAAWNLNTFLHQDDQHVLTLYGEHYPSIPCDTPMQQALLDEYPDLPSNFTKTLENLSEYGTQYNNTGAPWDVWGTDQIRWTDINETMSQAIAGQHSIDGLPQMIRERINTTLEERNTGN